MAIKNKTRDELIASLREMIQRKKEWEKQSEEDFKKIRQERLQFGI